MNHDDIWREHAACTRGLAIPGPLGLVVRIPLDPNLFFPEDGHKLQAARARQICAVCPVADDCLAYALDHFIRDGIWGGTTERQRRPMWRARRVQSSEAS